MKTEYLLTTLAALLLFNCEPEKPLEIISEKSPFGDFCFSVDTLRINISHKEKFIYPKFGTVVHEDSLYLIGYNEHLHAFDLFNLDGKRFVRRIVLDRNGPNAIPDVIGFTPMNLDSIYTLSANQIAQIDSKGHIAKKLIINNGASTIKNHQPEENKFWLDYNQPLYYDCHTNSVYGRSYSYKYGQCDPQRYQGSLISRIDFKWEKWFSLPITYPNDMSSGSFGFMTRVHTEWTAEELIYGFEFDPNIYVFNRKSGQTQVYDGRSNFTNNSVPTMSWSDCADDSKKLDHYAREVNFGGVIKDLFRDLHYRFHKKELPNSKLPRNSYDSKELYLSVFDKEYSKVGEVMLYDRSAPSQISFVGPKGLYLAAPENSYETLVFQIIKIEPIIRYSEPNKPEI